jgi:two-component system, sensor histidine kinase and response regulator
LELAGEKTTGVKFLESIVDTFPHPVRMLLTGFSDIEDAIDAINKGRVYRYIKKPYEEDEMNLIIDGAVKLFQAQEQYRQLLATLEDKVKERTERLVKLNNEKNEFLGIVAHDLKNPLGSIRMLATILHADPLKEEEVKEFSNDILSAAEMMFTLITNLLDVNRIERGFKVNPTPLDIAGLAYLVVENYQARAGEKKLTIQFQAPEQPMMVLADEVATMQVVDNLVSNAVKYSPNGANKNIFVRVAANAAKKTMRLEVQDEGPGLSKDDMEKLFGHFARLSAQPTGGEHSTGLGLSIVKKMVEAMNGDIRCESELGKGATFILELPMA